MKLFFIIILSIIKFYFNINLIYANVKYNIDDAINEVNQIINQRYIANIDDNKMTEKIVDGMMRSLDPHSMYFSPEQYQDFKNNTDGQFGGIGVEMSPEGKNSPFISVATVMKDMPAYNAGIQQGDIIIAVDDQSIADLNMYDIVKKVRGKKGTSVKLKIYRNSIKNTIDFTLVREDIKIKTVYSKIINWKDRNTGYIEIKMFNHKTYEDFILAAKEIITNDIDSLIIDVRNNPGGLLESAVKISNIFLQENQLITTVKARNDIKLYEYKASNIENIFGNIPIIILINKNSASASEILAACLKENKVAKIIGEKSFGKASVQEILELKSIPGSAIKITIAKYYTPNGNMINEIGVIPDIILEDTRKNFKNKHSIDKNDLILKKALNSFNNI